MTSVNTGNQTSVQSVNGRLILRPLGLQLYSPIWHRMQIFTAERNDQTVDEIWLLEHPQVFTQGRAGKAEHILNAGDIPVVSVDRGGQVTHHGPGQLVAYLLINLKRRGLSIRTLVAVIEEALIDTLSNYGVEATTRKGAPGVYVGMAKIASLGLRVSRGCSFHGLALNLNMDMEPFSRINPCGYQGLAVTQLEDLAGPVSLVEVRNSLSEYLIAKLGYRSVKTQL